MQASQADYLKNEGNKLFQSKRYKKSIGKYTSAIRLDPNNAVYHANRSAAYLELKKFSKALDDALSCMILISGRIYFCILQKEISGN